MSVTSEKLQGRPLPPINSDNEPPVFLISDLCNLLETYIEPEQVKEVYRAYIFSEQAHQGQKRLSGEPYIYHPLAVARILAEMHMEKKYYLGDPA